MNKTIKFRGQRVGRGEWVYGLPVDYCNKKYILVLTNFEEERVYEQYPHKEMWSYEVIPETVGQFTGVRDKNEKEIYTGDIVKHKYTKYQDEDDLMLDLEVHHKNYIIEWFESAVFLGYRYKNSRNIFTFKSSTSWNGEDEVIGTIFENPELLEVKDEI